MSGKKTFKGLELISTTMTFSLFTTKAEMTISTLSVAEFLIGTKYYFKPLFIQRNFTERKPLFFRNALIPFPKLHTFTPGSYLVQLQSDLLL